MDARTQTEYGTIRAVARLAAERRTGAGNTGTGERAGTIISARTLEVGNRLQTQVNVEAAFIQFAGITAGRAPSFFNDVIAVDDFHGLHYSGIGSGATNLLAYTASFGGGFSATLSLEDSLERRIRGSNVVLSPVTGVAWLRAPPAASTAPRVRLTSSPTSVSTRAGVRSASRARSFRTPSARPPWQPRRPRRQVRLRSGRRCEDQPAVPDAGFELPADRFVRRRRQLLRLGQRLASHQQRQRCRRRDRPQDHRSDRFGRRLLQQQRLRSRRADEVLVGGGALQVFWTPRLRSTFGASYAATDFKTQFAVAGGRACATTACTRSWAT